MRYLLDTNVISEMVKPAPDAGVIEWLESADPERVYLSAATIGEIRRGIELLDTGKRRDALIHWLERDLPRQFQDRILPADDDVFDAWGRMMAAAKRTGRNLHVMDGVIAATAQVHGLAVVTRNDRDFETLPVDIVNPWSD